VDRIAFATEGSRDLYRSLPFVGAIETCLIEELPSAAELSNARDHPEVPPTGVRGPNAIFVGVLEPRKGIGELMRAWESVEIGLPDAVLRIIGPGPLHRSVADWTRLRPDQRIYEGQQSRDSVLAAIGSATVLVAPSMPSGRWREQVGLPIKEALAAGLTVVTTDQTGLAFWLKSHGHRVVPAELVARDLAPELIAALCTPLDAVVVRATLPAVDGRYRSDSWLHRH
jgi:glycosyltransferase involved in cell wall biosynthesis